MRAKENARSTAPTVKRAVPKGETMNFSSNNNTTPDDESQLDKETKTKKTFWWIQLRKGFFSSPAMKKLRRMPDGGTYVLIYIKMMLWSVEQEGAIVYVGYEDTFSEEVAMNIDEDPKQVDTVITFLLRYKLMEQIDDVTYVLPEAVSCMGSETAAASRMRRFRERKKDNQA